MLTDHLQEYRMIDWLIDWLIDWIVFYALSAYNGHGWKRVVIMCDSKKGRSENQYTWKFKMCAACE